MRLVPLLLAFLAPQVLVANAAPRLSVQPAFEGWIRAGGWTAIGADIANDDAEWEGSLESDLGNIHYSSQLKLPSGSRKRIWIPIQSTNRSGEELSIELKPKRGEGVSAKFRLRPLSAQDLLMASLSDEGGSPGLLARATSPLGAGSANVVSVRTLELPASPRAFSSVAAVVASRWQPNSLQPEQVQALQTWVSQGGLLIVSADPDLSRMKTPWLADLLPARYSGDAHSQIMEALRRHTGIKYDARNRPPWTALLEPLPGSQVLLKGQGDPLAVCRAYGRGTVCALAFDVQDPVIASYEGWAYFALELIGLFSPKAEPTVRPQDIYQSVARALEEILVKVSLPKIESGRYLFFFSAAYIFSLIFGNLYFFFRRKKEDQIWAGMLGTALLFNLIAWGMGLAWHPRSAGRGLYIVEASPGMHSGRFMGYLGYVSGERKVRAIEVPPETDSAEEIHSNANVSAYAPLQTQAGLIFSRSESGTTVRFPMELGGLRYLRLEGQKAIGEGLAIVLKKSGGMDRFEWDNETGAPFKRFFIANSNNTAIFISSGPVPLGKSEGEVAGRISPLENAAGGELSPEEISVLSADLALRKTSCPECLFAVAIPDLPASGARNPVQWVYEWPIPPEQYSVKPERKFYIDPQPFRGNWNSYNDQLTLNSGELTLDIPTAGLGDDADTRMIVQLQGTWTSKPRIELFDREKGTWVSEAPSESALRDEFHLPLSVQASLGVSNENQWTAALISPRGFLREARQAGKRVAISVIDMGVDPKAAPSIVIGSANKAHVLYRKQGVLYHAERNGSQWKRRRIPESFNSGPPSAAIYRGLLHLGFAVPGKGIYRGLWDGSKWRVDLIVPDRTAQGIVGIGAADSVGACLCYVLGDRYECAAESAGGWIRQSVRSRSYYSSGGSITGDSPVSVSLSGHLNTINGLLVVDKGMSRETALVLRGLAYGSSGRSVVRWSANGVSHPERFVAGGAAAAYGGQVWASMITASGKVIVGNTQNSGIWIPTNISNASPPFAFAGNPEGTAFWIYKSPRGLLLRKEADQLKAEVGRGSYYGGRYGAMQSHSAPFQKSSRFIWRETQTARIRLTATSPFSLRTLFVRETP